MSSEKAAKKRKISLESDGEAEPSPKSSTSKVSKPTPSSPSTSTTLRNGPHMSDDGETYFTLANEKKRVTVRKFKGKLYVDIREFYEADGTMKPGKKGISLNLEDFETLTALMPEIEKAVAATK